LRCYFNLVLIKRFSRWIKFPWGKKY